MRHLAMTSSKPTGGILHRGECGKDAEIFRTQSRVMVGAWYVIKTAGNNLPLAEFTDIFP